jgi:hypothetical protein
MLKEVALITFLLIFRLGAALTQEEKVLVNYDPTIRPTEYFSPGLNPDPEVVAISFVVDNLYEVMQDASRFEIGFHAAMIW